METKIDSAIVESISRALGFDNFLAVDRGTGCEGVALMWQNDVCWDVVYRSNWFVRVNITEKDLFCWTLWLCHFPAKRSVRRVFWNTLGDSIK